MNCSFLRDMRVICPEGAQRIAVVPSSVDLSVYPFAVACEHENDDGFDVRFYPSTAEAQRDANAWGTAIWVHADGSTEVL